MKWNAVAGCICLALNFVASSAVAASYWEADVGPDKGVYYDLSSVSSSTQPEHKIVQVLTLAIQFPTLGGKKISHIINTREFDCAARRSQDLSMIVYGDDGAVIGQSKPRHWEQIPEGEVYDRIISAVCEGSFAGDDGKRFQDVQSAKASYLVKASMQLLGP